MQNSNAGVYSAANRKIIQMAIGSLGIKNMVQRGARLTIYLTVPLTILECFLKDHATMASLIGHVATDLAKIGIGAIMSAITGLLMGTAFTYAAAPIFFVIAVSVFTGMALEEIDNRFGLTKKLVEMIEQCSRNLSLKMEEMELKLGRNLEDAKQEFFWRAYGLDSKNGFQSVQRW